MTEAPVVVTLNEEEALQLVAFMSYVGPLLDIWFKDSKRASEFASTLGPKVLSQLIEQRDVTFYELQQMIKWFKVGKSVLSHDA